MKTIADFNRRLSCILLLSLVSTVVIINGCNQSEAQPSATPKFAEPFTLKTIDGATISLSDLRGKFVVVHFAATWCPFCNAEAPHLEALGQKYKDRNVQVLWINIKEDKELIAKWTAARKITFPVLVDTDGKVAASYAPPELLPDLARDEVMVAANLLIDPEGRIQFFSVLDSKKFDAKLIALTKRLEELLPLYTSRTLS